MKRESGYYWVKLHSEWTIGKWNGNNWGVYGYSAMNDTAFDEIDERKIERLL